MALSLGLICTKRVQLGLSEVAFIEGCPHVRGDLYEGFHCSESFESVFEWRDNYFFLMHIKIAKNIINMGVQD